jgi:hypothetical protein
MDVNLTKHNGLYLTCSIIHFGVSTISTLYHQHNLHKFDKPSMLFAPWTLDASKHQIVVSPNVFGHPMSHKTWHVNFALEERLGSVTKVKTNLVLTKNLHPMPQTLPSLENQYMV